MTRIFKHIHPDQFARHLQSISPWLFRTAGEYGPLPVGICVSGGPDSMVLAFLLHTLRLPSQPQHPVFDTRAFIVDHGVRYQSAQEAELVSERLLQLGIRSVVSRLDWDGRQLEDVRKHGFEEESRRLRYESIARNAQRHGISDLFTGHHKDDQYETLLMRMVRNKSVNILSFQGMATVSPVPCCGNVHGVYPTSQLSGKPIANACPHGSDESLEIVVNEKATADGMRMIRPLLPYGKNEILDTCSHFSIPFVTDQTNVDPTFTMRNAVRELRSRHALPQALGPQRLTSLRARADSISADILNDMVSFWQHVAKIRLRSNVGVVDISFKKIQDRGKGNVLRGLSYFMARMMELVSPMPSESWPQLLDHQLTEHVYSWLRGDEPRPHAWSAFSGVTMRKAVIVPAPGKLSVAIHRQPMRADEIALNTIRLQQEVLHPCLYRSKPHLWDNRFWVWVDTTSRDLLNNLVLRPYMPSDTARIKATFRRVGDRAGFEQFNRMLSTEAPGKLRFTLPVVEYEGDIVSFPTMQVRLPHKCSDQVKTSVEVSRSPRVAALIHPGRLLQHSPS